MSLKHKKNPWLPLHHITLHHPRHYTTPQSRHYTTPQSQLDNTANYSQLNNTTAQSLLH